MTFDVYQSRTFHQKEVSPHCPAGYMKGIHDLIRDKNGSGVGETGKIVEDNPNMKRFSG
jgi:hypothetical protein